MVIPIFEESLYVAKAKPILEKNCEVFCPSFEIINQLHNKWLFSQLQKKHQIDAIPSVIIKNKEDIEKIDFSYPYVLKPSYSRGSMGIKKIGSDKDIFDGKINKKNSWVAQKWIEGKTYCSYSICRNGKIKAHAVYANNVPNSNYCLSFQAIRHPKIYKWVRNFIRKLDITGHISFDFVETKEKKIYAIECNPRATSGLHLVASHANLSKYFIETETDILQPKIGTGRQLAFGMLMYGYLQKQKKETVFGFIKKHLKFKDVVFCIKDIKPFLLQLFVYTASFYKSFKYKISIPKAFIHDLNWEEEIDN